MAKNVWKVCLSENAIEHIFEINIHAIKIKGVGGGNVFQGISGEQRQNIRKQQRRMNIMNIISSASGNSVYRKKIVFLGRTRKRVKIFCGCFLLFFFGGGTQGKGTIFRGPI